MNADNAKPAAPAAAGAAETHVPAAGIALVVALAFLWGLNWPAIRVAVQEISPWTFRAVCLAVATGVLFGMSFASRVRLTVQRREIGPLLLVGFLNVTAWHMLTAFGLTMMEASRGILLAFTFPVWSVLIGRLFLRERLTPGRMVALALGAAAMALLLGQDIARAGAAPLGGLLLVGAGIVWALATAVLKMFHWSMASRELAAWQLLVGGVPVVIVALILDGVPDFSNVSAPALFGVFYASVIASSIGQWVWFQILQILPSSVAAISTLAIPMVGVFSGALLLDEQVGWRELTALGLVLAALSIVMIGGRGFAAIRRMLGR